MSDVQSMQEELKALHPNSKRARELRAELAAAVADDGERSSRARETRDANPIHEPYPETFEVKSLLNVDHIPQRSGYVRRWIRTHVRGVPDSTRVMRAMNEGWRPIPKESVPRDINVVTVSYEGDSVIGVHGMLLMERPESIHQGYANHRRRMVDDLTESVRKNLFRMRDHGSGMQAPRFTKETKTTVSVGRRRTMTVADD